MYNNFMLTQKLYKNGNSIAMTIPQDLLKELNLNAGSEVVVKKRGEELIVVSKNTHLSASLNNKFLVAVENFISTHHDVLVKLAKK